MSILNKNTLYIMKSINEGNDFGAISSLGFNSKMNFNNIPNASFISKVMGIGAVNNNNFQNEILTESYDKSFESQKNTVASALNLHYTLNEAISYAVANSISSLVALSEDTNTDSNALSTDGIENIKNTLTEGVIVMRDALENVFSGIEALNKKARSVFGELLGESNIYTDLIANAIVGANTLYSLDKIVKFKNENMQNIDESTNNYNIDTRADDILYASLTLEENTIKLSNGASKFNRDIVNVISEDNTNLALDVSNYIGMAIQNVAIPISEGIIDINSSNELIEAYNTAVTGISALYDQYIQDCVA